MKKTAILLLTVLLLSLFISSCNNFSRPKTADELWEKIEAQMSSLKSYTTDTRADLSFNLLHQKIEATQTIRNVLIMDDKGIVYSYNEDNSEIKTGDSKTVTNNSIIYRDNKMYVSHFENGRGVKLSSDVDPLDFGVFFLGDGNNVSFSPEGANSCEIEKNGDYGWTLTCSEYSKERVILISRAAGIHESYGLDVTDVSIRVMADAQYRIVEVAIDVFTDSAADPVLSLKTAYSDYNTATPRPIDPQEYNEVDDVMMVERLQSTILGFINRSRGKFITQVTHTSTRNQSPLVDESRVVSFINTAEEYSYNYYKKAGYEEYRAEYKNGEITTIRSGIEEKREYYDQAAKLQLFEFFDISGFDAINVRDVERLSDGRYKITCKAIDNSEIKAIAVSNFGQLSDYEWEYIVEMNGKLPTRIESTLIITAPRGTYTIKTVLELEYLD